MSAVLPGNAVMMGDAIATAPAAPPQNSAVTAHARIRRTIRLIAEPADIIAEAEIGHAPPATVCVNRRIRRAMVTAQTRNLIQQTVEDAGIIVTGRARNA